MSSFPVPVSPRIKTVESVGPTSSTCSSTDCRTRLVPMICWNRRLSRPSCPKWDITEAATFPSRLRECFFNALLIQSCPNAVEQDLIVKRLCQELHRTRTHRLQAHLCVAVRGYEND